MSQPVPEPLVATLPQTGLTDEQIAAVLTNVAPKHPALRRLHQKLNESTGLRAEASISSYDRMHHRHNRS
jgi:hypothetical protein